jgi:very-short-patch-repair endonuclease
MSKARARLLREKQTDAERELWRRLRDCRLSGWKFKRQVPKGPYIADFCCAEANLIIELDGGQHSDEAAVAYDARRTEFLQNSGYRVVRFWNSEIFTNLDGVIDAIWARLQEPPLPNDERHSLSPSGRGLG